MHLTSSAFHCSTSMGTKGPSIKAYMHWEHEVSYPITINQAAQTCGCGGRCRLLCADIGTELSASRIESHTCLFILAAFDCTFVPWRCIWHQHICERMGWQQLQHHLF